MDYRIAWHELAAQVRRLGYLADVQEDDEGLYFDEKFDERQVKLSILATVGAFRHIEKELDRDKDELPF